MIFIPMVSLVIIRNFKKFNGVLGHKDKYYIVLVRLYVYRLNKLIYDALLIIYYLFLNSKNPVIDEYIAPNNIGPKVPNLIMNFVYE